MDGWEWTKVGGALGGALAVALGGWWFAGLAMYPSYPEGRGYQVEGVAPVDLAAMQRSWPAGMQQPDDPTELRGYMANIEKAVLPAPATGAGPLAPAAPVDLGTLLAAADPARGKGTARTCGSCHTFEQGEADRVGPNLWAVVGRPIGGKSGYGYSPAIAAHGGAWTYQELDAYLASPGKAIPGNKMAFNGIRNPKDRANLLAYLGTLNATPSPFPAAKPAGTPEGAASTTGAGAVPTSR
jgi:cytochrome c